MKKKWSMMLATAFAVIAIALAVQVRDVKAAEIKSSIYCITDTYIGLQFDQTSIHKEVQLLDRKGKVLKTDYCYAYLGFTLSKNKLYSFRFRAIEEDEYTGDYYPVSEWSKKLLLVPRDLRFLLRRDVR